MPQCLIGLGSNLGDPRDQLDRALHNLRSVCGVSMIAASAWYRSTPVGGPSGQPQFLNGAVVVETQRTARELLRMLHETEAATGRHRLVRWEPRLLDLDLLLYGDCIIAEAGLRVPHPWMAFRPFVLRPAAEVASALRHPEIGWTIAQLADHLATNPKILALAPCSDVVFDSIISHLSEIPALYPLRFPAFDSAQFGGLVVDRAVEFMSDRAAWFVEQLRPCPTDATIVVQGWWDEPTGLVKDTPEPLKLKLREASLRVQRQLNPRLPHVTVGLSGEAGRSSRGCAEVETVYNYLWRPGRGPFLVLTTQDLPQIMHDIRAVVSGFHSLVQPD